MTFEQLWTLSVTAGLVAQTGFMAFVVINYVRGVTGRALITAAGCQYAFMAALFLTGASRLTAALELLTAFAWTLLFFRIMGLGPDNLRAPERRWQALMLGTACCMALGFIGYTLMNGNFLAYAYALGRGEFFLELLAAIGCLVVLEQIARNTRRLHRWKLRYLTIGAALMFGFAVVHHAYGGLMGHHAPPLVTLQPIVYAISSLMIAIGSLRNRHNKLVVNLSREFMFRSGVLFAIGIYLTATGLAGYYFMVFQGQWGQVVAALIITVSFVGLAVVIGSASVRRYLRVVFAKTLFEYKYDYREEWLTVTRELSTPSPDETLSERAVKILAELVNCPGGALWWRSDQDVLVPEAQLHAPWSTPLSADTTLALQAFCTRRPWVIDLTEYAESPKRYPDLVLGEDLRTLSEARLVIPLQVETQVMGIVVLLEPVFDLDLIWEDYDLIRVIARQATGLLALQHADRTLAEAKQLQSFHQVSAFLIHDLKTINSQLSLMLENAQRHKLNPAFVDDMLSTTSNSVAKMSRLLEQLRQRGDAPSATDLNEVVSNVLPRYRSQTPRPVVRGTVPIACVSVDRERLESALGHIIQNAIDATQPCGLVEVELGERGRWASIVVRDSGCGMTREFLHRSLFQPFHSTKGLTGMGIGVYQAREFARASGGDLLAASEPGAGSEFTFLFPKAGHSA